MRALPLFLLIVCLAVVSCAPADSGGEWPHTLVIAVDGLDWRLLLPALRDGSAPNILDLARRGVAARFTTFEPTDSPVIWTSVATGKTPDKHGIRQFAQRVGGKLVPVTSNQRLARPFWDILSEAGRPTAVIGWWVTWPAEPFDGWMLAPVSTVAGRTWKGSSYPDIPEQTWPPELMQELRSLIVDAGERAPERLAALFPPTPSPPEWLREFRRDLGWSATSDAIFVDAAEHIIRTRSPEVVAVYQGAIDVGGHRFWGYSFPQHPGEIPHGLDRDTAGRLSHYLPSALAELDAAVGRLRAAMPPDTDVIIVSDHGMEHRPDGEPVMPQRHPLVGFNTGAHGSAPDGVLIAAGPSFSAPKPPFEVPDTPAALRRVGDPAHPAVLDITPTLLHLHGLAVGEDMDGAPLQSLLVEGTALRAVRMGPSYEKGAAPRRQPAPIPVPGDEDVIERLRSLGYIGGSE